MVQEIIVYIIITLALIRAVQGSLVFISGNKQKGKGNAGACGPCHCIHQSHNRERKNN